MRRENPKYGRAKAKKAPEDALGGFARVTFEFIKQSAGYLLLFHDRRMSRIIGQKDGQSSIGSLGTLGRPHECPEPLPLCRANRLPSKNCDFFSFGRLGAIRKGFKSCIRTDNVTQAWRVQFGRATSEQD